MWKEISELEKKYDIFVSEQYAEKLAEIQQQIDYIQDPAKVQMDKKHTIRALKRINTRGPDILNQIYQKDDFADRVNR